MSEKDILEIKYKFFECLLEYKKLMEAYSNLVRISHDVVKRYQGWPYNANDIANLQFSDVENMLNNKLMFLAKSFNKRNINLFYFQDPETKQVFATNFFCKHILEYYFAYLSLCFDKVENIVNLIKKFAKRVDHYTSTHYVVALYSLVMNGKFYSYDKKSLEIIEKIQQEYYQLLEMQNGFYSNELEEEYIYIVKYYIQMIQKQPEENKFTQDEMVIYYQIDCDFCRTFGCDEFIPEITELYKDCMVNMGYNPDEIIDEGTPFFTKYVDPEFDPREFINKSKSELAAYKVRNDFSQIDEVFKEMAESISLTEGAIDNSGFDQDSLETVDDLEPDNQSLTGQNNNPESSQEEVKTDAQIKRIH